jgi:hypothetical protein
MVALQSNPVFYVQVGWYSPFEQQRSSSTFWLLLASSTSLYRVFFKLQQASHSSRVE